MKINMNEWKQAALASRKRLALPILTSLGFELTGKTIRDGATDSRAQADAIVALARRYDFAASPMMMDLSVEAEAFGAMQRHEAVDARHQRPQLAAVDVAVEQRDARIVPREVREAREPVLPGLGALDLPPWMERPLGGSGVIVPPPVETAHPVDVPRAWNPVLRRFEPVSIVLPSPSRESLREARERADAALGDPRGRIVCLDLFTTDTETL